LDLSQKLEPIKKKLTQFSDSTSLIYLKHVVIVGDKIQYFCWYTTATIDTVVWLFHSDHKDRPPTEIKHFAVGGRSSSGNFYEAQVFQMTLNAMKVNINEQISHFLNTLTYSTCCGMY